MLKDRWLVESVHIFLAIFTIYLFFFYFDIFFRRRKNDIRVINGIIVLVLWQLGIPDIVRALPEEVNIGVTIGITIVGVLCVYEGKIWIKCFFSIVFDVIWMLIETLIGNILMIYGASIVELQPLGSFVSKFFFFLLIVVLKKVFANEKAMELSPRHNPWIVFIPIGSIYIMNTVFMLAYRDEWDDKEIYSLVSILILLFINVLIFYIYIKLAEDLQIRRMNLVYEQQLELCARHKEETKLSMLQMRNVRHSMRSHLLAILAYAENGECEKIACFVNDIMEEGKLLPSEMANTGNVVMDSLVGYYQKTAKNEGIEFQTEIDIPMELPFKEADISLIVGNLLENAVEGARKAKEKRYIRLKMKYDRNNLLIVVENSYNGKLIKGKGKEFKTTKLDVANHGIGIPSVRRTTGKYQGIVNIDDTVSERFWVSVVLYGVEVVK